MHYDKFEDQIHAVVLERGLAYFKEDKVSNLAKTENGWTADVSGQSIYHAVLTGHHAVNEWYCNCPNEHGPVCKHVAATLYAIQDAQKERYRSLVDKLGDDLIREILVDAAGRSHTVRRLIDNQR